MNRKNIYKYRKTSFHTCAQRSKPVVRKALEGMYKLETRESEIYFIITKDVYIHRPVHYISNKIKQIATRRILS